MTNGKPELERAIAEDLDNPEPYLVYADWLQSERSALRLRQRVTLDTE